MSDDEDVFGDDDVNSFGGNESEGAEDAPAEGVGAAEVGDTADDMLVLVEDDATDIFNEADEELPDVSQDIEPTERERLTAHWKAHEKKALNNGKAACTTAAGTQHRRDVPVGVKRRAVVLRDGGMDFADVQIEVFVRSRALYMLQTRRHLP